MLGVHPSLHAGHKVQALVLHYFPLIHLEVIPAILHRKDLLSTKKPSPSSPPLCEGFTSETDVGITFPLGPI